MTQEFQSQLYALKNLKQALKDLHTNVHNSTTDKTQKVETTQMSISGWMDKQIVVNKYNEILFNHRKE